MRSPTERALRYLRRSGYVCQVTEHWVAHYGSAPRADGSVPGNRKDLFGFVDILAVLDGQTLAVQVTSVNGMSARYRKMLGNEPIKETDEKKRKRAIKAAADTRWALEECIRAGWDVQVWGFDKGMKVPKVRAIHVTDLVDQSALAL